MSEYVIEAVGLVKNYGDFCLGPVDIHVPEGFVTGMVGVNGSGKTTTLRSLLGLTVPDEGQISIPPTSDIGVAFDQPFLLPEWTIADAAAAYAGFRPGWDRAWFRQLCDRFGLPEGKTVKDLSSGESSKLMIALAMGNWPSLLLLDEPTSGLDPAARADLIDLLRDYMAEAGHTVLFSTHITSDLEDFADYLVFLDSGQVIYSGPLQEMIDSFAYVRGGLASLTPENESLVRGIRRGSTTFDGLIALSDTAAFGPDVQIETPTIEQVVVHFRSVGSRAQGSTEGKN